LPENMAAVSLGRIQKLKASGNSDKGCIFNENLKRIFSQIYHRDIALLNLFRVWISD